MLGGSVLGVWSHIEAVLGSLPSNQQCIRIIRIKTSSKRLVGERADGQGEPSKFLSC